jgi:hypothetical protein
VGNLLADRKNTTHITNGMTGQRDKREDQWLGSLRPTRTENLRKTLTCDKMGARENGERSDGGGGCASSPCLC